MLKRHKKRKNLKKKKNLHAALLQAIPYHRVFHKFVSDIPEGHPMRMSFLNYLYYGTFGKDSEPDL